MTRDPDAGSTLPLVLGFFLIAFLVIAGAVAAGDAYVDQRALQHVCDGAATAAASQLELDRGGPVASGNYAEFADKAALVAAVNAYLARDPDGAGITASVATSGNRRQLTLQCAQSLPVTFGALFGRRGGVRHTVVSSVRAALGD